MIQLDILSWSRTKNPTPTPSAVRNPTPCKNLRLLTTRLRNPACYCNESVFLRILNQRGNLTLVLKCGNPF